LSSEKERVSQGKKGGGGGEEIHRVSSSFLCLEKDIKEREKREKEERVVLRFI